MTNETAPTNPDCCAASMLGVSGRVFSWPTQTAACDAQRSNSAAFAGSGGMMETSATPANVGCNEGLASRIRSARKTARLTQAELASACGVERTSVTNIESGKQFVSVSLLRKLADVLKVTPSDLLDGPRVCCQRFDTCGEPCVPRASHWRDQASALQAEVNDLTRFIARQAVRAAG